MEAILIFSWTRATLQTQRCPNKVNGSVRGGAGSAGMEGVRPGAPSRGDTDTTGGEVGCAGGASGGRDWETEIVGVVDEEESSKASEVDGQKWQHQRKMMSAEFSTKVVRDFSTSVFKTNAVKLVDIIYEAATSNKAIEIQDLFIKATLDSIIKIVLGIELDSMSGKDEEGNRFSHAFEAQQEAALYLIFDKLWKIKRFLNIGKEAELKKNIKVVDQFVYKLINSKIEAMRHPEHNLSLKKRDLVSRCLELKDTDPKYLRDIVLCVTVAGQDTTSSSPSWFIYMMCKHLQIQEKIAKEVREVTNLKEDSKVDEVAASLTDEVLNKMQYLHAALTETLRLSCSSIEHQDVFL
ncbi:hypothetical protein ACLB2K_064702 [Fragaria x ananassa]